MSFDASILEEEFEDEQPRELKEPIPMLADGWAAFCDYKLVGNGEVTNSYCGKYASMRGCLRVELHSKTSLDGVNYAGKVFVRRIRFSCGKPSCPVCYKSGWAVREASSIVARLKEGSRRFGQVEHIVVSVPVKDYGLSESVLRVKCREALFDAGVIGGCMIFHGYRIDRKRDVLVWSPHYHVLGYLEGEYSRCRHCKGGDCYACDGLQGKFYKTYRDTRYIVRVLDERQTVFGTGHYQLNHATLRLGVKRFHVVTWFGGCGNRKFKSADVDVENVFPVCESEMVRSVYVGKRHIVKDVGHPDYVPLFVDDEFDENGQPNYIDVVDGG